MSRLACALCLICLLSGAAAQSVESNTVEDQTARNARGGASGAARSVLAEIARELITRSSTSSQVLSLNLTNLVILLVLKAIIFGAGSMGLGWAGKGAREAGEAGLAGRGSGLVSEQEAILVLSFLMGGDRDGYSCLNRVACQEPDAANSYARAGMLLTKGAKMMSGMIPYDDKFEGITEGLAEAVEFGKSGHPCEERYSCSR